MSERRREKSRVLMMYSSPISVYFSLVFLVLGFYSVVIIPCVYNILPACRSMMTGGGDRCCVRRGVFVKKRRNPSLRRREDGKKREFHSTLLFNRSPVLSLTQHLSAPSVIMLRCAAKIL